LFTEISITVHLPRLFREEEVNLEMAFMTLTRGMSDVTADQAVPAPR